MSGIYTTKRFCMRFDVIQAVKPQLGQVIPKYHCGLVRYDEARWDDDERQWKPGIIHVLPIKSIGKCMLVEDPRTLYSILELMENDVMTHDAYPLICYNNLNRPEAASDRYGAIKVYVEKIVISRDEILSKSDLVSMRDDSVGVVE